MFEIFILDLAVYAIGEVIDGRKWEHILEFAVLDGIYEVVAEKLVIAKWFSSSNQHWVVGLKAVGKVAIVPLALYGTQRLIQGRGNYLGELLKVLAVGTVDYLYMFAPGWGKRMVCDSTTK